MAASEARPVKRGRSTRLEHYVGPPAHVLVGARISVFWPDDDTFYKARCGAFTRRVGSNTSGQHNIPRCACLP